MPSNNSTVCSVMAPPNGLTLEAWAYSNANPREHSVRRLSAGAATSRPRHLKELDAIAIGVLDEAQPRAALAHGVRRLLWLDPLLGQARERRVEVLGGDRDVAIPAAELIAVHAEVVGQLEA